MKRQIISALTPTVLFLSAGGVRAQELQWARQFGTVANDVSLTASPDGSGGLYEGGYTRGSLAGPFVGGATFGDVWFGRRDSAGNQGWARQIGSTADEGAETFALDGAGGVYVAGWTDGALGGATAGGRDGWLARYDGAGTQLWIRQFGTSGSDVVQAATPDGAGGVLMCGYTSGALGGPHAGGFSDMWLARYDSAGTRMWIRQFGSSGNDVAFAAAADGAGGAFLAGYTTGTFGGTPLGGNDAWVARHDSAGNRTWIRQFGTSHTNGDVATGLAPDGAGGVFAAGYTAGSFGGTNAGGNDVWLLRFDGAGTQYWSPRQFGGAASENPNGLVADGAGGVYLAGTTTGTLFATSAGSNDVWVTRHAGAGTQVWARQWGSSGADTTGEAAADGFGGVYVVGNTAGALGGPNVGGTDGFAFLYSQSGACCLPNYTCAVLTGAACAAQGGTYRGNGVVCASANCPQPSTGACCFASYAHYGCDILSQANCVAQGGVYRGDNSTCTVANCPSSCYANCDGSTVPAYLNINDFVCFTQRFLAGDTYANCDGSTLPPFLNVNDWVCFLNRFAAGCPA